MILPYVVCILIEIKHWQTTILQMKVYLADLRHVLHCTPYNDSMPLGVGYMKAVMDERLPQVSSRIFAFPSKLDDALAQNVPDVLMLTNYMWNCSLSYYYAKKVKQLNPNALIVMGGPNIPIEDERRIEFLKERPAVDIYITGEGDFIASDLVEWFIEDGLNIKQLLQRDIHSAVYKHNGTFVSTTLKPRTRNLDEIPSPWLTGIMDEFFEDNLFPLYETNRGCPFTCTFCVQGVKWYTKVSYFSLERVKEEIYYIGKKVHELAPHMKTLVIADPNYGMFERDIEISGYIGEMQKLYQYPLIISATTGKNQAERVMQSLEKVNGALVMYLAVQSLDHDVLENVKRSNIQLGAYQEIQTQITARGMRSNSDMILGLPGDSLQSHVGSLRKLIDMGTSRLNNFQAILLKGSEMETTEARQKYKYNSKYRVLPKSYGQYGNDKVLEVEEIIVSSDSMNFDDYLTARTYHLAIGAFWNHGRFAAITEFMNRNGISNWQWLDAVTQNLTKQPVLEQFVANFIKETKGELFDSEEDAIAFYQNDKHFKLLLDEGLGDNIFYKHAGLASFCYWKEITKCVFDASWKLIKHLELPDGFEALWHDAMEYYKHLYAAGPNQEDLLESSQLVLNFDIPQWLSDGMPLKTISYQYCTPQTITIAINAKHYNALVDVMKTRPYNLQNISKFVRSVNSEWMKREQINQTHSQNTMETLATVKV